MVECGAGAPQLGGASLPQGMTGPQLLRQQMDAAIAHNLTVMRFWLPGVSPLIRPPDLTWRLQRGHAERYSRPAIICSLSEGVRLAFNIMLSQWLQRPPSTFA